MKIRVRLDDVLLDRARREAVQRGTTLTALLEQGLRLALSQPMRPSKNDHVSLPECRAAGGVLPGVDLDRSARLFDRMDGGG